QAGHVIVNVFGFKCMTVAITTLRRAELQLGAGDASASRESATEALGWIRERNERFFESEALRAIGDAERGMGNATAAEASYRAAIDVARSQAARLFEQRATDALAGLTA